MKITAQASSSLRPASVHPYSYRTIKYSYSAAGDERIREKLKGNFGQTALVFPIAVPHSHF